MTASSENVPAPTAGRAPDRIIIFSDLHMGAGGQGAGADPLECFFHDRELAALLQRTALRLDRQRLHGALVLNGDVCDFVRVARLPGNSDEVSAWTELLAAARVTAPARTLAAAAAGRFTRPERRYGLGAAEHDSVWKLWLIARGHAPVFNAFAAWCRAGHELVVLRGNHDVEWAWPGVRRAFRVLLERHGSGPLARGQVRFRMHSYQRQNLHIEHGHLVRWTTAVEGRFTRGRHRVLQQPFGSLLNRYLLNPVERLAERVPDEPSSLRLKRLVAREPGWLWRRLARNAFRDLPAAGRATWHIWHRRALAWWPTLVGNALALSVLTLAWIRPDLLAALDLNSAYARTGTALLAFATPQFGLALLEILHALRDDTVLRARERAARIAADRAGRRGEAEQIVVLGHTHQPELLRFKAGNVDCVYVNPSCWLGAEAATGGRPHFAWCTRTVGGYGRTRVLELDPTPGRCHAPA